MMPMVAAWLTLARAGVLAAPPAPPAACVVHGAATLSCFGVNRTDSTALLQGAIEMLSIRALTIDRVGSPWIVRPIYITRANLSIVLEPGTVLLAKQDEFHGPQDSLLTLRGATNIAITGGQGSRLQMRRADYAVPSWGSCPSCRPYSKAEWRCGIWIAGSTNVSLTGLTVAETGGDGVMILEYGSMVSKQIRVVDCVFERNYRQGMSVISVEDLHVERSVFQNTNGTPPMAGVDLEPDLPSHQLTNVRFLNNIYTGNSGEGFSTCLNALNGSSKPVSITFSGATVSNNSVQEDSAGFYGSCVGASYFRPGLQGFVVYEHVDVQHCPTAGIRIEQKTEGGPLLTLRNISLSNVSYADRRYPDPAPGPDHFHVSPVMMVSQLLPVVNGFVGGFPTVGGIQFDDMSIEDDFPRPWLFVWTTDGVVPQWNSIRSSPAGVVLTNPKGGCWVEHNRTNVTSLLPFAAKCSTR